MLHEVILVLAGNKSSIISIDSQTGLFNGEINSQVFHPSEIPLLTLAVKFGESYHNVTETIGRILRSSQILPGITALCSVLDSEIGRGIRQDLVQLERDIFHRNSAYVGGKDVVALSSIMTRISAKWQRKLNYCRDMLDFICPNMNPPTEKLIMERLRQDMLTGFAEIFDVAQKCLITMERVWLEHVSSWIFFGKLFSMTNFMIGAIEEDVSSPGHGHGSPQLLPELIPYYISEQTAQNILSLGIAKMQLTSGRMTQSTFHDELRMPPVEHLQLLSSLGLPIVPEQLESTVAQIKLGFYQEIMVSMLSVDQIKLFFDVLREICLVGNLDFARAFEHAVNTGKGLQSNDTSAILRRALSMAQEDTNEQSIFQQTLPFDILRYHLSKSSSQSIALDGFDDLVLGMRAQLSFKLDWPFDILLTSTDQRFYSALFSYLIALYIARSRLSSHWKTIRSLSPSPNRWDEGHKAKIFLDILWDYLQTQIDDNFNESLSAGIDFEANSLSYETVISAQSTFLKLVFKKTFIDSKILRTLMRQLIVDVSVLIESSKRESRFSRDISRTMLEIVQAIELYAIDNPSSSVNLLLLKLEYIR